MQVKFLRASVVKRKLSRFIEEYDEFHWAVAWGTYDSLADRLFANRKKFKNVTFGVAFSQTDPKIVQALVGVANGYIATEFKGGTYHPKVYGFRSGKKAAAIVGSSNFTRGGLGNNLEGAVVLIGTIDDQVLADTLRFARDCKRYGSKVTQSYADAYRESHKRVAKMARPLRNPVPLARLAAAKMLSMGWADFASQVHSSRHQHVKERLQVIAIARRWFASERTFAKFSQPQRKAIAGVLGKYQKTDPDLNRDWGWFGSMRGMGDFANRIDENDRSLARALDGIPRSGEVTQAQYDRFCSQFLEAFSHSSRTGGVPTASRLLAMKRPDTFLCVCKPNIVAASEALGFARTTLDLRNYWERVVQPIRLSAWYNAEKPLGNAAELWEARVAMLDVLFYQP